MSEIETADSMNYNHQYLLELVSAALNQRTPAEPSQAIHWDPLFQEAIAQAVHPLILSSVCRLKAYQAHQDPFQRFTNLVLLTVTRQTQFIEAAKQVLAELSKEEVPFLVLKGPVLRELYPQPEMRTMGDIDLLVRPEQLSQSCQALEGLGYRKTSQDQKHKVFIKPNSIQIELHHRLFLPSSFPNGPDYTQLSWQNAVEAQILGQLVKTQGLEDRIAYAVLHGAKHFKNSGMGLRQLCDLHLLLDRYSPEIDWQQLNCLLAGANCTIFFQVLLSICTQHLHLKIDYPAYRPDPDLNAAVLDTIFTGGVYGRKTDATGYSNILGGHVRTSRFAVLQPFYTAWAILTTLVFPQPKKLHNLYPCLKRYPFLLPAVWLHRLYNRARTKKFDKSFLQIPGEAIKKSQLLEKLEL